MVSSDFSEKSHTLKVSRKSPTYKLCTRVRILTSNVKIKIKISREIQLVELRR